MTAADRAPPDPDVRAFDIGVFLSLVVMTEPAEQWLADNLAGDNTWLPSPETAYGVLHVEHRYGPQLLRGMMDDGLAVYLDGEFCDG